MFRLFDAFHTLQQHPDRRTISDSVLNMYKGPTLHALLSAPPDNYARLVAYLEAVRDAPWENSAEDDESFRDNAEGHNAAVDAKASEPERRWQLRVHQEFCSRYVKAVELDISEAVSGAASEAASQRPPRAQLAPPPDHSWQPVAGGHQVLVWWVV